MKTKTALLGLVAVAALLPGTALANTTVFWGGPAEGLHIDSDGNETETPAFTFQIGAFDSGFNPGVAPFESWAANWNVFDQASYDTENNFFDSIAHMDNAGASDGVNADGFDFRGSKLYIWVYNSNVVDAGSALSLQWALISGASWNLPAITNENHALPLEFRLGNADQAWIGAVDPDGSGPVIGSLGHTNSNGPFDLQTHNLNVVPEPSAALLGLLGLGGLMVRRNRKA